MVGFPLVSPPYAAVLFAKRDAFVADGTRLAIQPRAGTFGANDQRRVVILISIRRRDVDHAHARATRTRAVRRIEMKTPRLQIRQHEPAART